MRCPQCQAENLPDSRFCAKCATPLPQDDSRAGSSTETFQAYVRELARGTVFAGRYEVIEELGKGGMGHVYRVFDRKLQEVIALKLLNPEISFSGKAIDRFRNELRFARKISHRNVVRLFDLGEEGFSHFITMEYVEGESLKQFIKRSGQLTPAKAVDIALQVCAGLSEAHHLGVIHRDLKPQNIMIDREGNARILDFGIARFGDSETITASGVMIGTPEYMSPEQIDLKEVDARTDQYSLGIIVFEMLTGRVPFEGETPISVALKHKSQPPPNPREINPQIDPALAGVILRCLNKDRDRRYLTIDELRAELERVRRTLPTTETSMVRRQPTASREITLTFRLRKLLIPGLAALALVAAFLVGRNTIFKPGPTSPSAAEGVVPAVKDRGSHSDDRPSLLGRVAEEAQRYLRPEEIGKLKDPQAFLEGLKKFLPQDKTTTEIWNRAYEKAVQGKKLEEEGRTDQAQKSQGESRMEMQTLMALMARRQAVQTARDSMLRSRQEAEKSKGVEKNILYLMARNQESSAEEAFRQNDLSGAKTLFWVLDRVYRMAPGSPDDAASLQRLRDYVAGLAKEVAALDPSRVDRWSFDFAAEIVIQAESFAQLKQMENAAASFIQAAFLYEKIKEQASSPTSKPTPPTSGAGPEAPEASGSPSPPRSPYLTNL
jgi:serine/threonine protein kinase